MFKLKVGFFYSYFNIYIEDKKLFNLGKSSVRRLLTIWTNISICSNDKDVIGDEGRRTRFVDFSDDDLIKVLDEGTDGVRGSKRIEEKTLHCLVI